MRHTNTLFLLWYDDSRKSAAEKAQAAIAAYVARFQAQPDTLMVSDGDKALALAGVSVETETYVRPNNYWVGKEAA